MAAQAGMQSVSLAIARGDATLPPLEVACGFRPPARASLQDALNMAERARVARTQGDRAVMLAGAVADVNSLLSINPQQAQARSVAAFIEAMRWPSDQRAARFQLAESYRYAPFLPDGSGWRAAYGMSQWDALTPNTRKAVIDEAIALSRINPARRSEMFAIARSSPAYMPFLDRWHLVRMTDADRGASADTP